MTFSDWNKSRWRFLLTEAKADDAIETKADEAVLVETKADDGFLIEAKADEALFLKRKLKTIFDGNESRRR